MWQQCHNYHCALLKANTWSNTTAITVKQLCVCTAVGTSSNRSCCLWPSSRQLWSCWMQQSGSWREASQTGVWDRVHASAWYMHSFVVMKEALCRFCFRSMLQSALSVHDSSMSNHRMNMSMHCTAKPCIYHRNCHNECVCGLGAGRSSCSRRVGSLGERWMWRLAHSCPMPCAQCLMTWDQTATPCCWQGELRPLACWVLCTCCGEALAVCVTCLVVENQGIPAA